MDFLKRNSKGAIGIILIIVGTLFGFLFSGKEIYTYNPVIYQFIWIKNWICLEYMKLDFPYFHLIIIPALYVRFAYLCIYGVIVVLLVKVLFANKKFTLYTFFGISFLLFCHLLAIVLRLYLPSLYFKSFIFAKFYYFTFTALTPPLLEVVFLTIFAYLESEMLRANKKTIIPIVLIIISLSIPQFFQGQDVSMPFRSYYQLNDSLKNVWQNLESTQKLKLNIIENQISLKRILEKEASTYSIVFENKGTYPLILLPSQSRSKNLIATFENNLLHPYSKELVKSTFTIFPSQNKYGNFKDTLNLHTSSEGGICQSVNIPLTGFLRKEEDEDLLPNISMVNTMVEKEFPIINQEYFFEFKVLNSGNKDLLLESLEGENKQGTIDYPKTIPSKTYGIIQIKERFTGSLRSYYTLKSNASKEDVLLIIKYKVKK